MLYLQHQPLYPQTDPERRGAALATIINGNLTMQGPVMLKQGFRGAVARTPVFIANVSEDNYFGCVWWLMMGKREVPGFGGGERVCGQVELTFGGGICCPFNPAAP